MQIITEISFILELLAIAVSIVLASYLILTWYRQANRLLTDLPLMFGIIFIGHAINQMLLKLPMLGILEESMELFRVRSFVVGCIALPLVGVLLHIWLPQLRRHHLRIMGVVTLYWIIVALFGPTMEIIILMHLPIVITFMLGMVITFAVTWKTGRLKEVRSDLMVFSTIMGLISQVGMVPLMNAGLGFVPGIFMAIGTLFATLALTNPWYHPEQLAVQSRASETLAPVVTESEVKKASFWSRVGLIPLGILLLTIGVIWRNVDVFILGFSESWLNILPCKLFPLLLIVGVFWKYRRSEVGSVLGLRRNRMRSHLVIGVSMGVLFYFLGNILPTMIYWAFFDSSFDIQLIIVNVDLLWYSAFFFLLNAIYEEVLFRGLLQNGFRSRLTPNRAILLSASVFGVYHLIWPIYHAASGILTMSHIFVYVVFSAFLAVVFGVYYEKFSGRRTLAGPIAAHWLINLLNENFKMSFDQVIEGPDVLLVGSTQMVIALTLVALAFTTLMLVSWKLRVEQVESWAARHLGRLPQLTQSSP
jgi:membrane protease YdiL (CAAX protease family)